MRTSIVLLLLLGLTLAAYADLTQDIRLTIRRSDSAPIVDLCFDTTGVAFAINHYEVYASATYPGPYALLTWLVPGSTTFTDPLMPGSRFYYMRACFNIMCSPAAYSDTVGYFNLPITTGSATAPSYTAIGLPGFYYFAIASAPCWYAWGVSSSRPSDIVGDQTSPGTATAADRIVRQDNGQFAYRLVPSLAWVGSLETTGGMILGRAFWYVNKSGSSRDLVLSGVGDPIPPPLLIPGNSWTPISFPILTPFTVSTLGLLSDGLVGGTATTSDRLVSQVGGQSAYYRMSPPGWQGTLTSVAPGAAYWIQNRRPMPWTYTYVLNRP